MNNEIEWRIIPSFPNYECSNTGLIRRAKTGEILKQRDIDMNRPYQIVSIWYNKKKYTKKVSRLIWEGFNDCACGLTIDHIDQNKCNNNLSNLRCITNKDNHANRTIYRNTNKYNLTNADRIKIITKYRSGEWTTWYIMNTYKLPSNYIYSVIKRGTWDKLINGNTTL
jgi:hypothetical protein